MYVPYKDVSKNSFCHTMKLFCVTSESTYHVGFQFPNAPVIGSKARWWQHQ